MADERTPVGRLQFELPLAKLEEIEHLRVEGGFDSKRDLLNNAITLLKWAMRHARAGHAVAAVDEKSDKYFELEMPFLTHLDPNKRDIERQGGGNVRKTTAGG